MGKPITNHKKKGLLIGYLRAFFSASLRPHRPRLGKSLSATPNVQHSSQASWKRCSQEATGILARLHFRLSSCKNSSSCQLLSSWSCVERVCSSSLPTIVPALVTLGVLRNSLTLTSSRKSVASVDGSKRVALVASGAWLRDVFGSEKNKKKGKDNLRFRKITAMWESCGNWKRRVAELWGVRTCAMWSFFTWRPRHL